MKNIITTIILLFAINFSYGQEDCKVLTESLKGTYEGDCKKGLAHGKGKAVGLDTYEGSFKKGLPNGTGKYTWSTGAIYDGAWKKGQRDGFGILTTIVDRDENTKKGYWLKNKYFGEYKKGEESKTINKLSITNVSYREIGDGNTIYIKISRMGMNMMGKINSLRLSQTSGIETMEGTRIIYDQIVFPFNMKVSFRGPNKMETCEVNYEIEFIINKPGRWEVKLDI